jgi:hypothetical protein
MAVENEYRILMLVESKMGSQPWSHSMRMDTRSELVANPGKVGPCRAARGNCGRLRMRHGCIDLICLPFGKLTMMLGIAAGDLLCFHSWVTMINVILLVSMSSANI